jgi:hypothetical protein
MKSRRIEKQALELTVERRARLTRRLLASLETLSEAEVAKLWLQESARRAGEIDDGKVRLVKSEELDRRVTTRTTSHSRRREKLRSTDALDYSKSKPNRFAAKLKGATAVILQPDVAEVFQSAAAVNDFLRSAIAATNAATAKHRPKTRLSSGTPHSDCPHPALRADFSRKREK